MTKFIFSKSTGWNLPKFWGQIFLRTSLHRCLWILLDSSQVLRENCKGVLQKLFSKILHTFSKDSRKLLYGQCNWEVVGRYRGAAKNVSSAFPFLTVLQTSAAFNPNKNPIIDFTKLLRSLFSIQFWASIVEVLKMRENGKFKFKRNSVTLLTGIWN